MTGVTTEPLVVPADRLPAAALEPVRPAYGSHSLADVLPSVCSVLGVPGAGDVLGLRDRLDGVTRVGVLLIDGLGTHNLPVLSPYAPTVADLATSARTLTAGFPSTTPVSLVTVGTGVPPGVHGILGFTVRRPDGRTLNHIHWKNDPDPVQWQPAPTRFAAAAASGVAVTAISKREFEGSGLTVSAYGGARFAGESDLAADMIAALSAAEGPTLVYGYHADLDKSGHEDGVDSPSWRAAARGVEMLVDRIVHGLPPRSALLVIADHGQLNVPADARYDMADIPDLRAGVTGVAGEPRVRYLYAAPGALDDVVTTWRGILGDQAWVLTRDEVIDGGWFGPVAPPHRNRIGDVVIVCLGRVVALAGGWEPPAVGRLIAYHASVTAAEMQVPLLIAR
ncbi:alkaline phosphatase family protein [Paractinoplanes brasiliensis]|uniref:Type I phosphodiesterase/nucleotide pyrophosphatase n=1 Tax=Paractinoplanes brasiliensis TaxID=52695 RepID=A0A4R6JP73_9ACTN|nr:nucleotide pyrophosphatase/phosphodiesterase family protein [Actinoplanes brasiliensis]TDO37717.1 type I phosphodiesterase/nucleotide pyrophosphatase [Actinoplanes brasiliensis]GID32057.1 alkaline phosphatase family protein [Actinoplanes brasiliensis]